MAQKMGRAIIADAHPLQRLGIGTVLRQAFSCESDDTEDFDGLNRLMASPAVVAVVDWDLPGFNSPAQIRQLRLVYPATCIIVVCTQCPADTVFALLASGAHGIIPKTLAAADVQKAFALVASGHIYIPRDICGGTSSTNLNGADERTSGTERLSARQVEVLRLAAKGKSNKEIGRDLSITENTVKVHLSAAFRQMGVNNRMLAVAALRATDDGNPRNLSHERAHPANAKWSTAGDGERITTG